MSKIIEVEKVFLLYFFNQGNQKFLKKPSVYALDMGITEDQYLVCLKNLSLLGYIKEGIINGSTEIELTSNGVSFCREIHAELKLNFFGRIRNHLEKRNIIYSIGISGLALFVSIGALWISFLALYK